MILPAHPANKIDDSPVGEVAKAENGDLYDEDTGHYFTTLDLDEGLPAQLSIYKDGYWYIFRPVSRYAEETLPDPVKVAEIKKEVLDLAANLDNEGKDLSTP